MKKNIKLISGLCLICLLVLSGFFYKTVLSNRISNHSEDEYVEIDTEEVPLAGGVTAYFYIGDSNNFSILRSKYVGKGKLQTGKTCTDSAAVDAIIASSPNISSFVKDGETVKWNSTKKIFTTWYVIGSVEELEVVEEVVEEEEIVDDDIFGVAESVTEPTNTIYLSREDILNAKSSDYASNDVLCWDSYMHVDNEIQDGMIPSGLLDDEVYTSMNLPSEAVSDYMISNKRDNAHATGYFGDVQTSVVGIGSIYPISGVELPDEMTVCFGKIATYGFSKSKNDWAVIDEQPKPYGIYIYKLPWSSKVSTRCTNVTKCSDHYEVKVTREELEGNVLHFWGKRPLIDKTDYLYYATAYQFWVKEEEAKDKLTAVIAIDSKDDNGGNILQLFTSRGIKVTNEPRVQWGHTIPNSEYKYERDGARLKSLFSE